MKIKYIARDGVQFNDEETCFEYERKLDSVENIQKKILLLDINLSEFKHDVDFTEVYGFYIDPTLSIDEEGQEFLDENYAEAFRIFQKRKLPGFYIWAENDSFDWERGFVHIDDKILQYQNLKNEIEKIGRKSN